MSAVPPAELVVFDGDAMHHLRSTGIVCNHVTATTQGRRVSYYVVNLPDEQCTYQLVGPKFKEGKPYYVGVRRA